MSARPSQASLKAHFRSITNALAAEATATLEQHQWDLHQAVVAYLSDVERKTPPKVNLQLEQLFCTYADSSEPSTILIDGTLQYLADLGLDPEDLRSLTLAYILKSPQTGEFKRVDFLAMWTAAGCVSIPQMRAYLDACHNDIYANASQYEPFYRYVFDFVRGADSRAKSILAADAAAYWNLLLSGASDACRVRVEQWCQFVEESARPVSKDTWNMWHRFYTQVVQPDPHALSGYDEMSAWPSMVDEYVEWLHESGSMSINT